jgi:two-component system NarL family sensor kinase
MSLTNATPGDVKIPVIFFILLLIVIGIWPVIGARIVTHHPRHPVGWLLFTTFPLGALDVFTIGYASYATSMVPGPLPIPEAILIWLNWSGQPFVAVTFTLMNLSFPTGKLFSPRWRAVAWGSVAALLVYLALQMVQPGSLGLLPNLENPYAVRVSVWATLSPIYFTGAALLMSCGLASVISLLLRLGRTRGDEHQQVMWLALPTIVFWIGQPFGFLAKYDPSGVSLVLGVALTLLSIPGIVIAVAFSIFKYHLYDIDLILNRTLVYGALTGIVIAIYILVVGAFGELFQLGHNLVISFLATGLVAVLFQPLRSHLQRAVNRMMYGERDNPAMVFARLGELLEASASPQETLPGLVKTIAQTLKLPYAAIELSQGGERQVVAAYGGLSGETERFPLVYQSEGVGNLMVVSRRPGEELTLADHRLLENIAHQAGAVAHSVRLTRELQRSRLRLVTAREEERRRLRRDLHDELGPQLASQALIIDALEKRLRKDPASAVRLLEELKKQSQHAVQDIRQIIYALRPPALDHLGLIGAVQETLADYQKSGVNFRLRATQTVPVLPAAVEVATYCIIQEAATNVIRHAKAKHCVVYIHYDAMEESSEVRLVIKDDGRGIQVHHNGGVGLNSMRERAAELGGELRIASPPRGGTCVSVRLPISQGEA